MDVAYRPATENDLEAAGRIVQRAYNELRSSHGLTPSFVLRPPVFQRFCLEEDPDGLWIAEEAGNMIGFGFAWTRQKFWYLAQLFVAPEAQGSGIGQALLSRTLGLAQRNEADNRALITMAYNTTSTGLYIRNGLYPREPLLRMAAPSAVIEDRLGAAELQVSPIEPWPNSREWLSQLDEQVLGFRRESHHALLLAGFASQAVQIESAGRIAGYAYISAEGHIGPLAISPDADSKAVVTSAIRCALEARPKQVSIMVPGKAERVLSAVSDLGFKIDEPFVLLSARPFGDWHNYLPSNPGSM